MTKQLSDMKIVTYTTQITKKVKIYKNYLCIKEKALQLPERLYLQGFIVIKRESVST